MVMNVSQAPAGLALDAYTNLYNGATLTIYAGSMPATPETALTGQTALCAFTFATPAFGAAAFASGFEAQTASFVTASVIPGNSGTATFARAILASTAWVASTSYGLNVIVTHNSNYYVSVVAGTSGSTGPTTTAQGISDGTTAWNYIAPVAGTGNVLADFDVGTSGTSVVIGSTAISTSVNVSITSCKFQIPAV